MIERYKIYNRIIDVQSHMPGIQSGGLYYQEE